MKSLVIGVSILIAGLGLHQYLRRASELQQLELIDRRQQLGTRFVNEIRQSDKEVGIPIENRDFTYRVHYNTAARLCFVRTEGGMSVPFGGGRILMTQVWDVNAGVGATAFAERGEPLSVGGKTKFYRGTEELPVDLDINKWFDRLMVE
jgi:hypothetical protein